VAARPGLSPRGAVGPGQFQPQLDEAGFAAQGFAVVLRRGSVIVAAGRDIAQNRGRLGVAGLELAGAQEGTSGVGGVAGLPKGVTELRPVRPVAGFEFDRPRRVSDHRGPVADPLGKAGRQLECLGIVGIDGQEPGEVRQGFRRGAARQAP